MALITKAVRGTRDVLPDESFKMQHIEQTALAIARDFGFREMRTPVFEHTELFQRSVGETTDVVQKEMYTFQDKGERSITLRPEGTAGMARAFLEHGLNNGILPVKISYLTSCYRYEKPQAGRLREFNQFGVECFGSAKPQSDAEVISLAHLLLNELGVTGVSLQINSIGCPTCRSKYHKELKSYFEARGGELCETCHGRLERNPMRILDCKSPICAGIAQDAPVMLDFLCDECRLHYDSVKSFLDEAEIEYEQNPRIVRGLDYYTRTVFEFVSDALGAQAVVCGGGRYDGLIEELGGRPLPSLGFGMGLERLLMVMEAKGAKFPEPPQCEVYLASMGQAAVKRCFAIVTNLRRGGVSAECDTVGRSLKAQMKYADKIGARYTIVVGDNELETGIAALKDMQSGEESPIHLDDSLYTTLYNKLLDRQLANVADLLGEAAE
ncbi:MAG: histidine--tRNA ligase [Oscillospiraceae bacterium]|nr:histidine--tRNA ligase [Oscillospiraceae bacterium]MDD4413851.1 histidine--tRNA ligase [Oscillospiraceae bacterium]